MYDILRTIEFFGGHRSKNEIVSMKPQSFYNKMAMKKMILVMEVTARERSEMCVLSANVLHLVKLCTTY